MQPYETMVVILPDKPKHLTEEPHKPLSSELQFKYTLLFLIEAASNCTEQTKPDRKSGIGEP